MSGATGPNCSSTTTRRRRVGIEHERGSEEPAVGQVGRQRAELAHVRAGCLGLADQVGHVVPLPLLVQGSHRGRLGEPVTEHDPLEPVGESLDDLVEAGAVHVDALRVHAHLAGGVEDALVEPVVGLVVELRVVEDDRGVVAAEFERHAGERPRRHLGDLLAAARRCR